MSAPGCPRCGRPVARTITCAGCGRDLTALNQVLEIADRAFNRGLRAAKLGRWHDAAEAVAVSLAMRPEDREATLLMARVAQHQGRPERVGELVARAEQLGAERTELDEITSGTTWPRRVRDLLPDRARLRAALPSASDVRDTAGVRLVELRRRRSGSWTREGHGG